MQGAVACGTVVKHFSVKVAVFKYGLSIQVCTSTYTCMAIRPGKRYLVRNTGTNM